MDDANGAAGWIYAAVDQFAATPNRPDGICGLIAIDPARGDWRVVLERGDLTNRLCCARGGDRLFYADAGRHGAVWAYDPARGAVPDLVARLRGAGSFAPAPAGDALYVSMGGPVARDEGSDGIWRIGLDGSRWERLPLGPPPGQADPARSECVADCSPDGEWLLLTGWHGQFRRVRPDGSGGVTLTWPDERCLRPRFAPDGRRIVFASCSHDGESLWTMDADGGERTLIVPEAPVTIVACWSPAGSDLVLKLRDCIRDERGVLRMDRTPAGRWSRLEIVPALGGARRPLAVPRGNIVPGGWRSA